MKVFIPVAWPYVNGDLHLGHIAGPILPADIFARYNRLRGRDTLMVTGSDMHGTPSIIRAEEEGTTPQKVALKYHKRHIDTLEKLRVSFDLYTRTDTEVHKKIVQDLFLDLFEKGFLVKRSKKQFWSEKEKKYLVDRFVEGECPHCGEDGARGDQCEQCGRTLSPTELKNPRSKSGEENIELKETEDFYLNLPKVQKELEIWIDNHPNFENWKENVKKFTQSWLREGLKERAITRDLSYGIPLPSKVDIKNKDEKVIYVWFEAVTGYWSAAVEWSKRMKGEVTGDDVIFNKKSEGTDNWKDFWQNEKSKHYYFLGKDNIVFHTIIWPAMLLGWNKDREEKMNLPWNVPANAWLNLEGKEMSKSKHWFVDLKYLIDNYGADLVRFYFTLRMPENKDSNFTWRDFVSVNNNELVGNLGNFVHRTLSFVNSRFDGKIPEGEIENQVRFQIRDVFCDTEEIFSEAKFSESLQRILKFVGFANKYFDKSEVWKVVKEDKEAAGSILYNCIQIIESLRVTLYPFMPSVSDKISDMLGRSKVTCKVGDDEWVFRKVESGGKLRDVKPLFDKLDEDIIEKERAKLGDEPEKKK